MATPRDSSKQLAAALRRIAGKPRRVTHGEMFRVEVTSRDGHSYAVTVQVDTHRKVPSKATLNDAADRLRVPRQQIDEVLENWTSEQLREYLERLSRDELRSRAPALSESAAQPQ